MSDDEPLQCPFCGYRAKRLKRDDKVRCENPATCNVVMSGPDALQSWNRRDGMRPQPEVSAGEVRAAIVLGEDDPHGDRAWQAQRRRRK